MEANYEIISKGFRFLLTALAPFIARELKAEYGKTWWQDAVINTLYDDQKRDLPLIGDEKTLVNSLDIQRCLLLFDLNWQYVFRKKLSIDHRTWAKELVGFRNKVAHLGGHDFSEEDTWRALDTMSRLCEQIDPKNTENIRALLRALRYGPNIVAASNAKTGKSLGVLNTEIKGLPSWRNVIEPHPDVAQGRYKNAEFAADLSQVANGEGSIEYLDPVEFFKRTYVTEGIKRLLVQGLKRMSGGDGEPVIQLKTAFGGGKTHSMLALYHIMRGHVSIEKIPGVKNVLEEAGVSSLPKAKVAVLVGTAMDPTKTRRPQDFPGITINTIWGEMAAQLARNAGNPKLYDYVKEADKKGVSPGSKVLKDLFNACGPCLILMDEIVAYARKLRDEKDLPAGTFDNFLSFVQEITEAARISKNSMIVASIPESNIEIGGESGQKALDAIEHIFGRMESIWKPVAANEGFEVVRRRLFLDCKDEVARELVANSFSKMYTDNLSNFPIETREVEYRNRIISCYPIHPEIFDRLYGDWATLERFQRTRGVLRLMAAVIHELWMGNDTSALIMPGSIPLDVPNIRDELIRHLPEGWNAIIDKEIDGKNSIPYQKDMEVPRFGNKLAARRVARTIMLGSAPTSRLQAVRGIEKARVRLGVVQPGENIADFNDALGTLQGSLAYLYTDLAVNRFWFDTRPTLRKTVNDRATQISNEDAEQEIKDRLRKIRKENPFAGIHICPVSSQDVPDEQTIRLVILGPNDGYDVSQKEDNSTIKSCEDILNNRGSSPRICRNMLVFVAPEQEQMASLKKEIKLYLAWKSIERDREVLNLDATQDRETKENINRHNNNVASRIHEAWCWLLVPYIDVSVSLKNTLWERYRLNGGMDTIVAKSAKKMEYEEALIKQWNPIHLKRLLDELLWKDGNDIAIKKLWECFCHYCYLPRLANYEVLEKTILSGLNSTKYFALAEGISEDGKYFDIKYNCSLETVNKSAYLVKIDTAMKQVSDKSSNVPIRDDNHSGKTSIDGNETVEPSPVPKNTRFFLSAMLNNKQINREVQKLVEEVISHLISIDNGKVEVSLEVNMIAPDGLPQSIVRTVSENCNTLKFTNFWFED